MEFDCIQEGRMEDALSSPEEIGTMIALRHLQIPDARIRETQTKNVTKGILNRDAQEDFKSSDIVERCIFMCLKYYRIDQWKQNKSEGNDYQALMQTDYEKRFTNSG